MRKPLGIQQIDLPIPRGELVRPGEPDLLAEGRLLHVAVPAGTGRTAVHVLSFYGYSGARSGNAWAKETNERAIRQVFRYAAALEGVPVLAAGDWNDDPERSPALDEALRLGWKDLAQEEARKTGQAVPDPTYVTETGS